MAEPFMTAVLGTKSRIQVQIAWGANLMADDSTWTWTDITNKVFVSNGITVTIGRADEAQVSQPAQCSFTVSNTDKAFSLGGLSPNWPNVRRNTPVRVRVDPDGTGFNQMFLGYVDTFSPAFDLSGNIATCNISASGVLRRLAQNTQPLISPIRRASLGLPELVAYWPCEDDALATSIATAIPGDVGMNFVAATPDLASSTELPASAPLLKLNNAWLGGELSSYPASLEHQVRFLIHIPTGGSVDAGPLISVFCVGGSIGVWDLIYRTTGDIQLIARDNLGAIVLDTTTLTNLDGRAGQMGLSLTQNGANIDWIVTFMDGINPFVAGGTAVNATLNSHTTGQVNGILVNGGGFHDNVTIGHITVERDVTPAGDTAKAVELSGGLAELVWSSGGFVGRLERLGSENNITIDVESTSATLTRDFTHNMGRQSISSLVPLLREAEASDQGMLMDGTTQGLRYLARQHIESAAAAFTVDAGDLVLPSGPVADDQNIVNKVQVTQKGGTTGNAEDVNGPLGTNTIGIYDLGATISMFHARAAEQYAHYLLSKGTIDGYRYPQLAVDVAGAADPKLMANRMADLLPGDRIDVLGFDSVFPQHPPGKVELLVQGYTHTLTSTSWRTTLNVSLYEPHRIVVLAADTGDTGEFLLHLDTDNTTLTDSEAIGSTSFRFTTVSGPLWTTVADDFPFDVEIEGIKVTVTNITGASSPQTVTVVGATVTKALTAGASVKVWRPTRLGL